MNKQKIYLNYEDYGIAIENLINKIKKSRYKFEDIYGIPRGGLPIAVELSHKLNLPLVFYPTKNTLVVDDISDEGNTLKDIKNKKIATLYTTPWTKTKPDFYVLEKVKKSSWIVFPWEI